MDISVERTGEQTAVLTLNIVKDDYQAEVDKGLKAMRKQAHMPGFRPGYVPMPMIKRMYGAKVLAQEFNKAVEGGIKKAIEDNKLEIFGYPLPAEGQEPIDLDNLKDQETLKFEVGLQPEINIELDKMSVDYFDIEITDKEVDDYIDVKTARHQTREDLEEVSADAHLRVTLAKGDYKKEDSYMSVATLKDDAAKALFVGKKKGETFPAEVDGLFANESELAYTLGVKEDQLAESKGVYDITIEEAYVYRKPELTQELFDKIYGEGNVKSLDEFRSKVREEMTAIQKQNSLYKFGRDLMQTIKTANPMTLPEKFLRRWIEETNKDNEKATPEVIEQEFPKFLEDLKTQRITATIARQAELKPTREMIEAHAVRTVRAQFEQYGLGTLSDDELLPYAQRMMQDKEQQERLIEGAMNNAVVSYAAGKVQLNHKPISGEEFNKLLA